MRKGAGFRFESEKGGFAEPRGSSLFIDFLERGK